MKTGLKVLDIMTTKPISVPPSVSIRECASIMKKNHVGSVIVSENGALAGIISEQDIVYKVVCKGLDPDRTAVKRVMTREIITIRPGKDINEALNTMKNFNVRRLPVIDSGNEVLGIITSKDILKVQPDLFEILAEKIELREEARKPINRIGEKEGLCELCGEYTDYLFSKDGAMVCSGCRQNKTFI